MKTINMKLIGGIIMLFFQMQLRCQDIRTIYVDKSDRIKQFIMIDDKKAVALAEGTGRFKLTNTIL